MTGSVFFSGALLGLGAAMPIGPVNVEIARRTILRGAPAGIALGLGAVTIDVCFAIIVALGVARLADGLWVKWPLMIAGTIVLGYLGFLSLRGAWRAWQTSRPARQRGIPLAEGDDASQPSPVVDKPARPPAGFRDSLPGGYLTGLAMTGLNPYTWAFWLGGVSATARTLTEHPERDLPIIFAGVFAATLTWVLGFTAVMAWLKRLGGRRWLGVVDAVGGLMLIGFAVFGLVRAVFPATDVKI